MVWPAARGVTPKRAHHAAAETFEKSDGPAERVEVPVKGTRDQQGRTLGAFEGDGLGHELADDHVQHREEGEGQRERYAMSEDRRAAAGEPIEHRPQQFGQRGFAKRAEAQTGERDADLHAGDDAIELAEKFLNDSGAGVAELDELADARDAHGHEGEFRGGEETVDDCQRQHG